MNKEILIEAGPNENRVAVVEDGILEEFYVERSNQPRLAGNIYKARVNSLVPGIGAAFIDLGPKNKDGFLYVSDATGMPSDFEELLVDRDKDKHKKRQPKKHSSMRITDVLKKSQDVIVQIVKEPVGTKGARLTTHIALPGRFLVFMPEQKNHIGISKRISSDKDRNRIKSILGDLKLSDQGGFIVRTAARNCKTKDLAREARFLSRRYRKIMDKAKKAPPPRLLYEEEGLILRIIRDSFTEDVNVLWVNSKDAYRRINGFLNNFSPSLKRHVKLYRDKGSLFEKKGLHKQIERLYNKKVFLKSGGYIIIEGTESLVAIDVNTGRYTGKKNLEETVFKTNLEAADEVARQLRLRDRGGIVVIDFIDMEVESHRKKVFQVLSKAVERDRAKTNVLSISNLGLVEMTRQRIRTNAESLAYKDCPYCKGHGQIKTPSTLSLEALRRLETYLAQNKRAKSVRIHVNPEVARQILGEDNPTLKLMERDFGVRISIIEESYFHPEQIELKT
ncbi:MAG: Rne/Rng family ribonuclease [Candidatus Omnitrophica bacterium]|nr:Rne/Rng family ribonuclease [Candidatus Omnitrophota bacterium]